MITGTCTADEQRAGILLMANVALLIVRSAPWPGCSTDTGFCDTMQVCLCLLLLSRHQN